MEVPDGRNTDDPPNPGGEDKIEVIQKVKKTRKTKGFRPRENQWSDAELRLFFHSLKKYGKDYGRIHEFMRKESPGFIKPYDSIRFIFNRILQRTTRYVKKYIQAKNKQLKASDVEKVRQMIDLERIRGQSDKKRGHYEHLCLVLAYGELYMADLMPVRPDHRHFRKLFNLLLQGYIIHLKDNKKTIIELHGFESIRKVDENVNPENIEDLKIENMKEASEDRLELDLAPKTISLLLLMKQRFFSPRIRINIPLFCRVRDIATKLINYWRLPLNTLKNSMNLYHLTESIDSQNTKSSVIRLLLDTEFFSDLKPVNDKTIKLLYELNLEKTPEFDDHTFAMMTLHMIPKLAKVQLGVHPLVPQFKKPEPSKSVLTVQLKTNPPAQVTQQLLPVSKRTRKYSRKNVQKPQETPQPIKCAEKSQLVPAALSTPLPQEKDPFSSIFSFPQPDFDFKLFGMDVSSVPNAQYPVKQISNEATQDTRHPYDFSNFSNFNDFSFGFNDSMDQRNLNLNQADASLSQRPPFPQDNLQSLINDESNLGFLAHFGFSSQPNQKMINPHQNIISQPHLEESHQPTNYMPLDILETPKFENITTKDNKDSKLISRRLFFETEDNK